MDTNYIQKDNDKKQLSIIKEVFSTAQKNNLFLFIKGGWNIDLAFGKQTRKHGDIDFHFYLKDTPFWTNWFKSKGYSIELIDSWYSIFRKDDIQIDFEAVDIKNDLLIWKHGGTSQQEEVIEKRNFEDMKYMGMNLGVETYLKNKILKKQFKDNHDLEIISYLYKI